MTNRDCHKGQATRKITNKKTREQLLKRLLAAVKQDVRQLFKRPLATIKKDCYQLLKRDS